jgi:hypothetical protein
LDSCEHQSIVGFDRFGASFYHYYTEVRIEDGDTSETHLLCVLADFETMSGITEVSNPVAKRVS